MARIHDLIAAAKKLDPELGADLEEEFTTVTDKRTYGLVWEKHLPEPVEIPSMKPTTGDTVRVLPPRGELPWTGDQTLWVIHQQKRDANKKKVATLIEKDHDKDKTPRIQDNVPFADLVTLLDPKDVIYPGLRETGRVHGGEPGDPEHVVINGENLHALKALTFTHTHSIDAIYIDPPYNTGAKDWKYGNDYVDSTDAFRHSKFLSFLEKRLLLAKELLNPEDSVMIVTIDEKEYLRVGQLLEQTFPEARIQMVSSLIKPGGNPRSNAFNRSDEYLYFVKLGKAKPSYLKLEAEWGDAGRLPNNGKIYSRRLIRNGANGSRYHSPGCFYPVFIQNSDNGPVFHSVGEALPEGVGRQDILTPLGATAIWPIKSDGSEGRWQTVPDKLRELINEGFVSIGKWRDEDTTISYMSRGERQKIKDGEVAVVGRKVDGSLILDETGYVPKSLPGTQWRIKSHDASENGTNLIKALLGEKRFTFPKSLYAVEDPLRFFVKDKPNATILDFFGGSGTTAHAVMRLNKQDGGSRNSITVTNNAVSEKEEKDFSKKGLRAGDEDWEKYGICDYVTKPRIKAAITGETPQGEPIKGQYKYNDEFPMSDGIAANARFFTLTYHRKTMIEQGYGIGSVSNLLWLKSGARGEVITEPDDTGIAISESHAIITDPSNTQYMVDRISEHDGITHVFVFTDSDHAYESLNRQLIGKGIETVKMNSSYFNAMEMIG